LALGRLAGVRTQVVVMALLVAAIVSCVVGLSVGELALVLSSERRADRRSRCAEAACSHSEGGAHRWGSCREIAGAIVGSTEVACATELALCRLHGIRTQVVVMSLLVAAVVGCMVGLGASKLTLILVAIGRTYSRRSCTVAAASDTERGANRRGSSTVAAAHANVGYTAELALSRLYGVRAQIVVMTLLVAAVVSRVISLGIGELGLVLVAETGVGVLLTVHRADNTGGLERPLEPAVLGSHVLGASKGRSPERRGRGLGIRSQVVVVTLLVTAIACRMIILRLVHCDILLEWLKFI